MAGSNQQFAKGFSLTEVLLAVGTLAVGMLFIAGVFPVSIHLITISSERTIAATVADEAFAKIKLYGVNLSGLSYVNQTPLEIVSPVPSDEFAYPSTPTDDPNSKKYWWSAICRRIDLNDVQVTVFVSRKAGVATTYRTPSGATNSVRPVAVPVQVALNAGILQITNVADRSLINDGYTIVDDAFGQIYRVLERYGTNLDLLRLNETWQGSTRAWVVPPPVGGGRYPCVAVYQKVVRF
jgi:Tfp pilus assembly protein PilV